MNFLDSSGLRPIHVHHALGFSRIGATLLDRHRHIIRDLVGPPLEHHIDVEILAGYVEGVVVVLNKPLDKETDEAVEFVRNLKDLRAPLLGCVLCD